MTKPKRTAKGLLFGPRPMGPGPQPRNPDTGLIEPLEEEGDGHKPDAVIDPADIQELLAGLDGEPTVAEVRDVLKKLLNLLA